MGFVTLVPSTYSKESTAYFTNKATIGCTMNKLSMHLNNLNNSIETICQCNAL